MCIRDRNSPRRATHMSRTCTVGNISPLSSKSVRRADLFQSSRQVVDGRLVCEHPLQVVVHLREAPMQQLGHSSKLLYTLDHLSGHHKRFLRRLRCRLHWSVWVRAVIIHVRNRPRTLR
eukprot:TRINITY_DN16757_c0_g1_i2.p1 TRINITY_DN16757_c0_g1~~TRINITY_DN16757_c0_g1_i2.p1  ORF type:complete len:119 (-),score=1.02 TRINITY_DN16757_c0_g1_i2:4-360(-)